jgi:hypothetical protein
MHEWLPEKVLAAVDAAFEDLKRHARQVYWIDAQGREVVEIDPYSDSNRSLLRRVREAQDAAEAAFLGMLRAGRLVAWAREGSPVAPLRRIPADGWTSLRLEHVEEGRAQGPGVRLFGIRVAPAAALQRATPAGEPKANDNAADAGAPPAEILATGTPGRPTSMHLIRAEHRRRLDAGEAHHSVAEEARHLAAWFAAAHPNAPQPTPKTIENGIRATHRQHAHRPPK